MTTDLPFYPTPFDELLATGMRPLQAFKHVHETDLGFWRAGSILLGTPSYYREIDSREPGIQDATEGIFSFYVDVKLEAHQGYEIRERLARHHVVRASASSPIEMRGVCFDRVMTPEPYLLCLCAVPYAGIFPSRKAVIEIRSCVQLAKAIAAARPDALTGRWEIGLCRYDKKTVNLGEEEPQGVSPFWKEPKYSYQREIRICFEPKGQPAKFLTLESEVVPYYCSQHPFIKPPPM